jgi:UDP-N-acetylmuramate dehydrogenase
MSHPQYLDGARLRERTTLALGGPARRIARVADPDSLREALERNDGGPVAVLGAGSNLIVADRGFSGLLLQSTDRRREYDPDSGELQVGGGHDWDDLVRFAVEQGASGIECMSGIPGLCGAAPVQNIGAYGQELSGVLESVEAVDLASGRTHSFSAVECAFGYRRSRFKEEEAGRWFITRIRLRLRPGGTPTLGYRELVEALGTETDPPLERVRQEVLRLRRSKSMVYDPSDANHRSAGSFFTNPVVSAEIAAEVENRAGAPVPAWPVEDGRMKLAAAWLIERAGFGKGHRQGRVGLSTRHVLALVNLGGATTVELLDLARSVRDAVAERFGIRLRPEPVPLGFEPAEIDDLWGTQASR